MSHWGSEILQGKSIKCCLVRRIDQVRYCATNSSHEVSQDKFWNSSHEIASETNNKHQVIITEIFVVAMGPAHRPKADILGWFGDGAPLLGGELGRAKPHQ